MVVYRMSLVIGLTGGIASGKTTVAELFAEQGITIIDTDIIAREVVMPGTKAHTAIVEQFGSDILQVDQQLDRQQLRQQIFADANAKQWLEDLLHPLIREQSATAIAASHSAYAILAIPLLYETWPNPLINRVLVVDCDIEQQRQRLLKRDTISPELAEQMLAQQATREQRLSIADDVITNDGSLDELAVAVLELHKKYLAMV